MIKCEHQYGLKKRPEGYWYCPVCRASVFELESQVYDDIRSIGQGKNTLNQHNGWRPISGSSRKSE